MMIAAMPPPFPVSEVLSCHPQCEKVAIVPPHCSWAVVCNPPRQLGRKSRNDAILAQILSMATPAEPRAEFFFFFLQILGGVRYLEKCQWEMFKRQKRGLKFFGHVSDLFSDSFIRSSSHFSYRFKKKCFMGNFVLQTCRPNRLRGHMGARYAGKFPQLSTVPGYLGPKNVPLHLPNPKGICLLPRNLDTKRLIWNTFSENPNLPG